ncbi:MAG: hypothetical protein HYZ46_08590 [Nitrosomonadales bacterium]|nr:hypothetical protein [Nitrosomonadales bacterium]
MKYILLASLLSLAACDGSSGNASGNSSGDSAKIAAPQRAALEKAKGVDQTLQQANEAEQKKISEAEGK